MGVSLGKSLTCDPPSPWLRSSVIRSGGKRDEDSLLYLMCQCGCRQLHLNLALTSIFEIRFTHGCSMGGLLGPFPISCGTIAHPFL